jgi:FkbM family methyltransferase
MDSLNLISSKKVEYFSINQKDQKGKKLRKCILISLTFLFISDIFTKYFIFNLNKKVNIKNMNNEFPYISKRNQKIDIDNEYNINKLDKPFNKNNNINNKNSNLIEEYINRQNNFCNNPDKFYNQKFEELIKLTKFSFRNISYKIYTYNKNIDGMSNEIIKTAKYEPEHISNFLDALRFYGKKNKINKNKDIFMLDIGGNLGVYPSFLGKFGYSILTFEASPRNSYIIYKNYCLINKNSNIIIVNKGLSSEEKTCNYYSQINAIGNGVVLCNENKTKTSSGNLNLQKTFEVKITKLSNFFPYLSNKKIALIKLDIEGGEGKVIEDAIELINKYHVPFIFSEFDPKYLMKQGTNPKKYIELFTNNGYKISYKGFLTKDYINPKEIKSNHNNLYFIYDGI